MARPHAVDDLRAPAIRDTFPYPAIRGVAVPHASREVPEIVCPFPHVEPHPEADRLKHDNLQWIIDNGIAPPYAGVTEDIVLAGCSANACQISTPACVARLATIQILRWPTNF